MTRPAVFTRAFPAFALLVAFAFTASPADAQEGNEGVATTAHLFGSESSEGERALLSRVAYLDVEKVPLQEALDALHVGSGVAVAYSPTVLPPDHLVTCRCEDASVKEAMQRLLRNTRLEVVVAADQVVVRERRTPPAVVPTEGDPRMLPVATVGLRASVAAPPVRVPMQGTIQGRVVDAQDGSPVRAAEVHISALGIGALTGVDGTFTLADVPAGTHVVRVQLIGYRMLDREVTVASGEVVEEEFRLAAEALALDELVVTGVVGGTQRRAIGNVVEQIDVSGLQEVSPASNVEQLLSNRVPGLTSVPGAGIPGADAARIRLRGSSSTALPNDPIIYIDGIRVNSDIRFASTAGAQSRMNDINPQDIESIEVIKGPAAATLYGTEASAGVIQIITKRGMVAEPTFDARVELGGNFLPNPERRFNDNWALVGGQPISHNLIRDEDAAGTPVFSTGLHQVYSLSARGGTEMLRYSGVVTRTDREGAQPEIQWDRRTSARLGLSVTARENLDIDATASFSTGDNRFASSSQAVVWGTPGTRAAAGGADDPRRGFYVVTPDAQRDGQRQITDVSRSSWSVSTAWQPMEWLRTRAVAGVDYTREDRTTLTFRDPDGAFFGLAGREGQKILEGRETQIGTFDASGTAAFRFMEDRLGSESSAGFQYFNRQLWDQFAQGNNFATGALTSIDAAAETFGGEDFVENTTVGVFVQQQVDWEQRIFVTGAIRGDDNSAFGADFDAAIYPKLSATWVLHEEEFFDLRQVDQLRLRGAWGKAGRQPDFLDAARLYTAVTGPGEQPTIAPLSFGNPDLGPEEGSELELGFDASVWDDRIQVAFTRWWKSTTDAIVARPVAPSQGFAGAQFINVGEVRNWGSETQLDIGVLRQDPVRWDLNIGFARMKNRLEDLGEGLESLPVRRGRQHRVGYPLASIFEYVIVDADFVSGDSGPVDPQSLMCDLGAGPDGLRTGGAIGPCLDADGNTVAPRLYHGHAEPTWVVNLASTFTVFDNWRLYVQMDARGGHAQIQDAFNARHTSFANTEFSVRDHDPIVQAYRLVRRDRLGFHKGGFARLREVAVNYTLPAEWAQRVGASRASMNVAGRNLATPWRQWTYTDIGPQRIADPEMNLPSEEFPGEVTISMPPLTSVVFSFNVSF
jgi:TonB-dependent starch-binding outer membrane protein SusC